MLTFLVFLVPFTNLTIWSLSTLDLQKVVGHKIKKIFPKMVVLHDDFPMVESKKHTLNWNKIHEYWVAQKIITAYHQLGDYQLSVGEENLRFTGSEAKCLTYPPGN